MRSVYAVYVYGTRVRPRRHRGDADRGGGFFVLGIGRPCPPVRRPLSSAVMSDVTRLLDSAAAGDPQAAADLLPLVYDELRKLAAARLADERPGQPLQATALVHEAYLRLVGGSQPQE